MLRLRRKSGAIAAVLAAATLPLLGLAQVAHAAPGGARHPMPRQPMVKHVQSADSGPAVHHDRSLPLRVLAARAHPVVHHGRIAPDRGEILPHPAPANRPDPVVQRRPGLRPAVPTTANFDGISGTSAGNGCGCTPPDPNAAVGTTQVVEIVNTAFAVFSKTGGTVMAPTSSNTLWSGFGGNCQTNNDGDATVAFDKLASRWVIQQ